MLEDEESAYARCWTEVWWFFVRGVEQVYPEGAGLPGRVVKSAFALGVAGGAGRGGGAGVGVGVEGSVRTGARAEGGFGGGGDNGDGGDAEVGDVAGVGLDGGSVVGERVRGEQIREDEEGTSHSFGAKPGSLARDEANILGTSFKDEDKGGRERTTAERGPVEKEVVYVDRNISVDPVVVKGETKVDVVERPKEVDNTIPKKQKAQLGRWGRVQKAGWKLGKSHTTSIGMVTDRQVQ